MSSALVGRFFTTEPRGKPVMIIFIQVFLYTSGTHLSQVDFLGYMYVLFFSQIWVEVELLSHWVDVWASWVAQW